MFIAHDEEEEYCLNNVSVRNYTNMLNIFMTGCKEQWSYITMFFEYAK